MMTLGGISSTTQCKLQRWNLWGKSTRLHIAAGSLAQLFCTALRPGSARSVTLNGIKRHVQTVQFCLTFPRACGPLGQLLKTILKTLEAVLDSCSREDKERVGNDRKHFKKPVSGPPLYPALPCNFLRCSCAWLTTQQTDRETAEMQGRRGRGRTGLPLQGQKTKLGLF